MIREKRAVKVTFDNLEDIHQEIKQAGKKVRRLDETVDELFEQGRDTYIMREFLGRSYQSVTYLVYADNVFHLHFNILSEGNEGLFDMVVEYK